MNLRIKTSPELIVWDLEAPPVPSGVFTVLWSQSVECQDSTMISISAEVEAQAHNLRSKYISWVYNLSTVIVTGKSILDYLTIRPGLSYWWMSAPAQKFNLSGNNGIHDSIKLLALERILECRMPASIRLHSDNQKLAACLESLCETHSIEFLWIHPFIDIRQYISYILPPWTKAFCYLLWYSSRALRCTSKGRLPRISGQILFMDILVHLGETVRNPALFKSNYWTALLDRTKSWGLDITWGHLFFRHDQLQTPADACALIERLNLASVDSERHFLLEAYFGIDVIWNAVLDYLRLGWSAYKLRNLDTPPLSNSSLNPWPLHQAEFRNSLTGKDAIINCIRLSLFEKVLRSVPRQQLGVYISENQPWELAFIHAWRTAGHGRLIGVPHTTVRFWDLRYHNDNRTYSEKDALLPMPQPDLIAINGPLARASLLAGGYPEQRLRDVEALRFLHLQTFCEKGSISKAKMLPFCVLVCADFQSATNFRLLAWLKVALTELPPQTRVIIKPHPAFSLDDSILRSFLSPLITLSTKPIHELLAESNVVFASNTTSASIYALCAGVPVVQMMDGHGFNASPLRSVEGIHFVNSPYKLSGALLHASAPYVPPTSLFNFDIDYRSWHQLITNLP